MVQDKVQKKPFKAVSLNVNLGDLSYNQSQLQASGIDGVLSEYHAISAQDTIDTVCLLMWDTMIKRRMTTTNLAEEINIEHPRLEKM